MRPVEEIRSFALHMGLVYALIIQFSIAPNPKPPHFIFVYPISLPELTNIFISIFYLVIQLGPAMPRTRGQITVISSVFHL